MNGLLDATKGMFVRDDGSIKWNTLIGIAAGAAIGALALPFLIGALAEAALVSAVMGAFVGLMASQAIEKIQGDGVALPSIEQTTTATVFPKEPGQGFKPGGPIKPLPQRSHEPRGR